MTIPKKKHTTLAVMLALVLPLWACDDGKDTAAADQAPQAGEGTVAANSSLSEDSPGGEAVTEQEIPQSDVPPPSRDVFSSSACDFEQWVGKPVDEAAIKETGRVFRILKPDSMMTMDHNPERINVVHDDEMIVTRVWCG